MKTVIEHKPIEIIGKIPIAVYLRVSSSKDEQLESYHAQKEFWEQKFANSKTHELIQIYGDEGISGKTQYRRDGFTQMLADAKQNKFKTIYTKSLSRFGRNGEETITALQTLRDYGINVVFDSDNLDTNNMSQELLIKIRAILAEEESNTISINVKWSYKKRFRQGILNTQNSLYGYTITNTIDDTGQIVAHWQVNEEQAEVVQLIYKLYLQGYGKHKIILHLKSLGIKSPSGNLVWSDSVVMQILSNEKYVGHMLLQKRFMQGVKSHKNKGELPQYFVENSHQDIVSQADFDRVQQIRQERSAKIQRQTDTTIRYELSSKVCCGLCDKTFKRRTNTRIKNTTQQTQWICSTQNSFGISECRANIISDELLKDIILDCYNTYLDTPKSTPLLEKQS